MSISSVLARMQSGVPVHLLQGCTIVFALEACLLAILIHPLWGWLFIGVVNFYFSLALWSLKQRYRFNNVQGLSSVGSEMLQQYSHYFAMPVTSRASSASAATNQFGGVILGVISVVNGFWLGIVLAVANWVWMGLIAGNLSPASLIASDPVAKMAHDEVTVWLEFMGGHPTEEFELGTKHKIRIGKNAGLWLWLPSEVNSALAIGIGIMCGTEQLGFWTILVLAIIVAVPMASFTQRITEYRVYGYFHTLLGDPSELQTAQIARVPPSTFLAFFGGTITTILVVAGVTNAILYLVG